MPGSIHLTVGHDELEYFCHKLVERSRDPAKTLDTLVSLEAFLRQFGKSALDGPDYAAMESLLRAFAEQTRNRLLEARAAQLLAALTNQDLDAIVRIHGPLSRDGFYQVLQAAIMQLPDEALKPIAAWSVEWSRQARNQAEQASGFPDALNFTGAGIRPEDYQAMLDVSRCLGAIR